MIQIYKEKFSEQIYLSLGVFIEDISKNMVNTRSSNLAFFQTHTYEWHGIKCVLVNPIWSHLTASVFSLFCTTKGCTHEPVRIKERDRYLAKALFIRFIIPINAPPISSKDNWFTLLTQKRSRLLRIIIYSIFKLSFHTFTTYAYDLYVLDFLCTL